MRIPKLSVRGWIVLSGVGFLAAGCGTSSVVHQTSAEVAPEFIPEQEQVRSGQPAEPDAPASRWQTKPTVLASNDVIVAPPTGVYAYQANVPGNRMDSKASTAVVTADEVVRLSRAGIRDDVIIDRIERSAAAYRLTAREELLLRQQGVSEDVIYALKEMGRR